MKSICSADGWWVHYKNGTTKRVACFVLNNHGSVGAYVYGRGAYMMPAEDEGEIAEILHDDGE